MDRLSEIRARCEAATTGPWKYQDNGFDGGIYGADHLMVVGGEPHEGRIEDGPDAQFIAHSREDIPYLLEEIERIESGWKGALELANNNGRIVMEQQARAEKAEAERGTYKAALQN